MARIRNNHHFRLEPHELGVPSLPGGSTAADNFDITNIKICNSVRGVQEACKRQLNK